MRKERRGGEGKEREGKGGEGDREGKGREGGGGKEEGEGREEKRREGRREAKTSVCRDRKYFSNQDSNRYTLYLGVKIYEHTQNKKVVK